MKVKRLLRKKGIKKELGAIEVNGKVHTSSWLERCPHAGGNLDGAVLP